MSGASNARRGQRGGEAYRMSTMIWQHMLHIYIYMYMCVCVYIYIYIYKQMHIHIYIYIHTCIYIYIYIYTYVYIYTYTNTSITIRNRTTNNVSCLSRGLASRIGLRCALDIVSVSSNVKRIAQTLVKPSTLV